MRFFGAYIITLLGMDGICKLGDFGLVIDLRGL